MLLANKRLPYGNQILVRIMGAYHLTEKSGRGVEGIMVSDLLVYHRNATFESKKRANLCSVSLEPRRNREIGLW